jgi:uncharacterized protein YjiS (DUF1127 family)
MHQASTRIVMPIAGTLNATLQRLRRWHRERRTISALQALSDAELKDIGVHRCAIPGAVHERCAAQGRW